MSSTGAANAAQAQAQGQAQQQAQGQAQAQGQGHAQAAQAQGGGAPGQAQGGGAPGAGAPLPVFAKHETKEFNVRVMVLEARELKGREDSGISDPVCYVSVNGHKQHTEVKKKTLNCSWNHCFFWTLEMNQAEFENCKIQFDVFDANTIRRNVLIGSASVDLKYVFQQERRELNKQWVALTDIEGNFDGAQGFLRFSSAVSPEGEALPPPPAEDEDDEDEVDFKDLDLQSLVMNGPDIKLQEYLLNVNIWKAEGLPKTDRAGLADPFVVIKFGGRKHKTQVVKKTLDPAWNESVMLPCALPSLSDRIEILVYDWDTVGNDLICANYFSFAEVLDRGWGPGWLNMYGVPGGDCSEAADPYNRGFYEGTSWRGRIFLQLKAHPAYQPKLATKHLPAASPPQEENYTLRVDMYECAEVVNTGSQIFIEFVCGHDTLPMFKSKGSAKRGSAKFYKQEEGVIHLPNDLNWNVPEAAPDLLVNVYTKTWTGGRERVGYMRLELADIYGFNNAPRWYTFKRDDYGFKYDEDQMPGMVLMKLNFGKQNDCPPEWPALIPLEMRKFEVRCHLYQGSSLPAADDNGLSDPYVVFRIAGQQVRSDTIKETVNPRWYKTYKMKATLPTPLDMAPPVSVLVYDHDLTSADDLQGRFMFPTAEANADLPDLPKWYGVHMDDPDDIEGELLCSFQLVPWEDAKKLPLPEIQPRTVDCYFEINAIGLRDMLPFRLSDIAAPVVVFDVGEEDSRVSTTAGKAKVSGRSSALLETLHASVQLPVHEIFAPMINVRVFDDRALGQVLVGSASIPIAPYLPWAKPEVVQERLARVLPRQEEKVVEELNAALEEDEEKKTLDRDENGMALVRIDIAESDDEKHMDSHDIPLNEQRRGTQRQDVDVESSDDDLADYLPDVAAQELSGVDMGDAKGDDEEEEESDFEDEPPEPELPKVPPLPAELEVAIADDIPFEFFELYRGQTRGLSEIEKKLMGNKKGGLEGTRSKVGMLKARFRVIENSKLKYAEDPIDLRKLYKPKQYVIRTYILKGHSLTPQDSNGFSDPYVLVSIGKQKTTKKEGRLQEKTNDPEFFHCYEMVAPIPGDPLRIEVWDHDFPDPDDLIGFTTIDLENRFFSRKWQEMDPKPIEFRTLWTDVSRSPQGKLEMFVEILSKSEARRIPPRNIAPPPPKEFELRVIVWSTKDCAPKDGEKSDIFVAGMMDDMPRSERQETDSHWNSKDGTGSFNWRMKFPIVLPNASPRLKLSIWDKDLLSANDIICEAIINLKRFFKQAYKNDRGFIMDEKWIKCFHPNVPNVVQGQVLVTIELMTKADADSKPNGLGRHDPNKYPMLPEPDRPSDSFNPLNPLAWAKYGAGMAFGFGKKMAIMGIIGAVIVVILMKVVGVY